MNQKKIRILLADDDIDDCIFFTEAINELEMNVDLHIVHDGQELLQTLSQGNDLPDVVFMDLNMPRKNGEECLAEITHSVHTQKLPVVVYSTSFHPDVIDKLYASGAFHYIRKPAEFSLLKRVIKQAVDSMNNGAALSSGREDFVITGLEETQPK